MIKYLKKTYQYNVNQGEAIYKSFSLEAFFAETPEERNEKRSCCIIVDDNKTSFKSGKIDPSEGKYNTLRGDSIVEEAVYEEVSLSKEELLQKLKNQPLETIISFFPDAHYVVERSYLPSWDERTNKYEFPWRRVGRRSYLWAVPAAKKDVDPGRRIQWGGNPLYASRKEALAALYS